jgi:RNA-directed DNA polymerase
MHEDVMEQIVTQDNATDAWLAVKRNAGAPGIDGMTTQQLRDPVRLEVNATKSGTGRPRDRKFVGFRINPEGKNQAAAPGMERFKMKVREMWRSCQSQTSDEQRDAWRAYVRGWWGLGILPTG